MKKMIVFDGNSILNRAFYGVRPLNTKDGFPTNALYGFVNILKKNLAGGFTHAAVAFDLPGKTFRHTACESYKANRKGMPPDLAKQLPLSKEISRALGLNVIECEGYEADDIIGTLSKLADESGIETVVVTGDRDSYQLVSKNVTVWFTANNDTKIIDEKSVNELYNLAPSQLIDLKAIMGDASDNIKGVPGIGEKGASSLIQSYGSLDGVYRHLDEIKAPLREKLIAGKESAYLSRFLAEIEKNAKISQNLDDYIFAEVDGGKLFEIFSRLEFSTLITSLGLEKSSLLSPQTLPTPLKNEVIKLSELISRAKGGLYAVLDGGRLEVSDGVSLCGYDFSKTEELFKKNVFVTFWSVKEIALLALESGFGFECSYDDVSLMAYLVSQSETMLTPEKAIGIYLGEETFTSVIASLPRLKEKLWEEVKDTDNIYLYEKIENPLALLLAKAEHKGFSLDAEGLKAYSDELEGEMERSRQTVYFEAGRVFNLNSPKQLAAVLFEELKLPHYKKNQTGYSTDAEVLEKLAPYHPIIPALLNYRKISKLKYTYCDGLLAAVSQKDGRVHTTFRQTLTKTGRLSSIEPNLQNIPVRTEEGKRFRDFFRSGEGKLLIDADYSQIELRILAHISGDEALLGAFAGGKDIHTATAAKVFGVGEEDVTPEMRKRAKAVNFGIVYGIGGYSLGRDLSITTKQASEYIASYFNTYPKVKSYLDGIKEEAKEKGYVATLYGRRRYIPELRATKKSLAAFGERVAMNTPIQGTAADIIKKAMTDAEKAFEEKGLDAAIILQIHDELIVESSEKDAEAAKSTLIYAMENACELKVKLTVDAGVGKSWSEAKGN